jgi:hypothetical protein
MMADPMEVNYAVICESASVDARGKVDIKGAFDKLTAPGFPFLLADKFCVVVNYSAGPAEYDLIKHLRVALLKPDGQVVGAIEQDRTVDRPPEAGRRATLGQILTWENVIFEDAGDYAFSILVGGEEKRSLPLYVYSEDDANGSN